jgi:isoquinoline 1-oxidoreductase subunit alpha
MIRIRVNGVDHELDVDPETPLLWVVRDHLGLKAAKYGCGAALCGACSMLKDGEAIRSCVFPVRRAVGAEITTLEGLAEKGQLHPVQQAWIDEQVPQCGYCQPGFIVATAALLRQNPHPTDEDIDRSVTNLCRCGTYERVRKAIHRAAGNSTP